MRQWHEAYVGHFMKMGATARCGLLLACVAALWLPAAAIGHASHGAWGVVAATLAAAVCVIAAVLALLVGIWLSDPRQFLQAYLLGMLLRMGIPLLAVMLVYNVTPALMTAGFLYHLLVFYLVLLLIETLLTLPSLDSRKTV